MEVDSELLDELRRLEELLHSREVRADSKRLNALLHPEVEEFGRSGKRYGRAEIQAGLSAEQPAAEIRGRYYELSILADGVALLTYVSAQVDKQGHATRHVRRSSLWLRTRGSWQLRFHQGTPIDD